MVNSWNAFFADYYTPFATRYSPFASMRAGIHFDGDMRQPGQAFEPLLVDRRCLRSIGYDGGHHRGVARTELPQMQGGYPVAADLDALADASFERHIGNSVEQHAPGGADQAHRP